MINPVKTIVTHLNPDLDALCCVWLIKRFLPGWEEAQVQFVPAGDKKIINDKLQMTNENEVLYVDTGFGELDHHQTGEKTCAAKLVWEYIKRSSNYSSSEARSLASSSRPIKSDSNNKIEEQAVDRLTDVVLRVDFNAEDITIPHADDDFYSFLFNERQIIRGIRTLYRGQSEKHLDIGIVVLDAVFEVLKAKIEAEKIIQNGVKFKTRWGKGVGADTNNEMFMHLAQGIGFKVVVAKDPKKGHVRIHALPQRGIDFTQEYKIFKKLDKEATWFLHSSKSLLLNGSSANPEMKPTKLTLQEVIDVLKIT